jgi:hypothetical protein
MSVPRFRIRTLMAATVVMGVGLAFAEPTRAFRYRHIVDRVAAAVVVTTVIYSVATIFLGALPAAGTGPSKCRTCPKGFPRMTTRRWMLAVVVAAMDCAYFEWAVRESYDSDAWAPIGWALAFNAAACGVWLAPYFVSRVRDRAPTTL